MIAPPSPASTTPSTTSWNPPLGLTPALSSPIGSSDANPSEVDHGLSMTTAIGNAEQTAKADRLRDLETIIGKYLAVAHHPSTAGSARRTGGASRSRTSTNVTGNGTGNDGDGSESASTEQDFANGVMAIRTVAQEKLYTHATPPFATLETFFLARYSLSRAQVYRHLTCAYVVADLLDAPPELNVHPLPRKQRVAKAVKDLAPNPRARQRLWASTLAHFPRGHEITSSDVCRVAASMGATLMSNEPFVLPGMQSSRPTSSKKIKIKEDCGLARSLSPLLNSTRLDHQLSGPEHDTEVLQYDETTPRAPCPSPFSPVAETAIMVMNHAITPTSPTFFPSNSRAPSLETNLQHEQSHSRTRANRVHSVRHQPYPHVARHVVTASLLSPPVSPTSLAIHKTTVHRRDSPGSASPRFIQIAHLDGMDAADDYYRRPLPETPFLSSPIMSPTVAAPPASCSIQHDLHFPGHVYSSVWTPPVVLQDEKPQLIPPYCHLHEHMARDPYSLYASPPLLLSKSLAPHSPQPQSDVLRLPPLVSPLVQPRPSGHSPMVTSANAQEQGHVPGRTGYAAVVPCAGGRGMASMGRQAALDWNCALPPMEELLCMADRVAAAAADVGRSGDGYFPH